MGRVPACAPCAGGGSRWNNLHLPGSPYDNVTLLHMVVVVSVYCLIYALFVWYLDNVWPWQYGIPKEPLFCFKWRYWQPPSFHSMKTEACSDSPDTDVLVEAQEKRALPGIALYNVTKAYSRLVAVRHVSIQAYPGDVTVLLGRNGAGKTTLLRLITGLERATEGSVIVGGHDVATDTDSARRSMGFCPQENILFPGLTVLEHLQLFARVRRNEWALANTKIDDILVAFSLDAKRDALASSLSWGMKRKLQLGIAIVGDPLTVLLAAAHHIGALGTSAASTTKIVTDHYGLPVLTLLSAETGRLMTLQPTLIGNLYNNWQQRMVTSSQVLQKHEALLGIPGHDTATETMYLRLLFVQTVVLDEPTSGADPECKGALWECVLRFHEDKTMLVTTHSMEEADTLGDRIAVMAEGRLRCCGSPMFLRATYGTGYWIKASVKNFSQAKALTQLVRDHVPRASVEAYDHQTLNVNVGNPDTEVLIRLLKRLDKNRDSLLLETISVSVGALEDVLRSPVFQAYSRLVAVRHVSLQAYPGDVTVLLGRNGAGKTTLLRLITGLEQATEGTVIVGGHDVATDTDSARRSMGFCPQENILFPGLTVLEHLQLFARVNLGSDSFLAGVQGD
ncbi:retinal-specific phospholipid-transporting ATPase ABCA4 [Ixodes scapularis]